MDSKILDKIEEIIQSDNYSLTTEGGFEWEGDKYTIEFTAEISSDPHVLGSKLYIILYTEFGTQSIIIPPRSLYSASFNGRWKQLSEQCFPTDQILKLFKP